MATSKRHPVRSLVVLMGAAVIALGALVTGSLTTDDGSMTPKLALDLEGGTQLILTPIASEGSRAITDADIVQAIDIIRQRVDGSGVSESEITQMGSNNISVSLPGHPSEETLDLIRSSSQMDFRPVLQVSAAQVDSSQLNSTDAQSGAEAQSGAQSGQTVTAQSGASQSGQSGAVEASQSGQSQSGMISTALSEDQAKTLADTNQDGVISDQPTTQPTDNSDTNWITEKVLFDFYTLDCTSAESRSKAAQAKDDEPTVACDQDGLSKYILGPVDVPGSDVSSATAGMVYNSQGQSTGQWGVNLEMNSEGTQKFADSSKRLYQIRQDSGGDSSTEVRDRFAVVLDGQVITAPSMNAEIKDGKSQISGNFTPESAKTLANQLNFGSLPLNFEVQSEQQISATLGSNHLEKAIWAGLIGLVLVVIYMLWQYHALAALSAGSLLMAGGVTYLVITLLSWLMGYRLSLAGVAGLIVAVGITADSFIVYFERIRDEVRDGRRLSVAVEQGWQRAKRTILISDMVNLVAAIVLYVLAVGGVQGFAFTLGVTTVVDLAIIFFFTHPIMELLVRTRYFGEGRKFSGFDSEHLGAKNALIYAGRGRVVLPKGTAQKGTDASDQPKSLAQRRLEEQQAKQQDAQQPDNTSGEDAR